MRAVKKKTSLKEIGSKHGHLAGIFKKMGIKLGVA